MKFLSKQFKNIILGLGALPLAACGEQVMVDMIINNPCNENVLDDANAIRLTIESESFKEPKVTTFNKSDAKGAFDFDNLVKDAVVNVSTLDADGKVTASVTFGPKDLSQAAEDTPITLNLAPGKVNAFNQTTPLENSCGMMSYGRVGHTATALKDGRILIVGGEQINSATSTTQLKATEIYDPSTSTFTAGPDLPDGSRKYHTATLLPNGKVVIAGGISQIDNGSKKIITTLSSIIIYDPESNEFTIPESDALHLMKQPRALHSATLLKDGRIIFAGGVFIGNDYSYRNDIEFWDEENGSHEIAGVKLNDARAYHSAILLADENSVAFIGGQNKQNNKDTPLASVEIFRNNAMLKGIGALTTARTMLSAILIDKATILISGGYKDSIEMNTDNIIYPATSESSVELFKVASDYSAKKCSTTMLTPRAQHLMSKLPDGQILVTGGLSKDGMPTKSAELITVKNSSNSCSISTTKAADMTSPRASHVQALLPGGDILFVSGQDDPAQTINTAEFFVIPHE